MLVGPRIAVDPGGNQAAGKGRAQQQMIDAQTGVAKAFRKYFQNV